MKFFSCDSSVTWRGICAVLTPLFLVCCCMVPLLIMAIPFLKAIGNH